jgi:hypothetical protein
MFGAPERFIGSHAEKPKMASAYRVLRSAPDLIGNDAQLAPLAARPQRGLDELVP